MFKRLRSLVLAAAITITMISGAAVAEDPFALDEGETDLFELPLEELVDVSVTSVAGYADAWFTTPAAVHVITSDDIRRSGHQHLAEALRLAPGVHVAKAASSVWSVGVRGTNNRFSNKLLVLIDDRAVYNPIFSGVLWETQDVLLADLEQIEVVRGPGATIWGANAVNGVINVVSKPASETQGWYVSGGVGNELQGFGRIRFGGEIDPDTHFRIWSKYTNYDVYEHPDGNDRGDDWHILHGGFRLDRETDVDTTLSVWGDFHASNRIASEYRMHMPGAHQVFTGVSTYGDAYGGSLQARLERENPADQSGWRVQAYYWGFGLELLDSADIASHTFDVEFRHRSKPHPRHELIWGTGYRLVNASIRDSVIVTMDPEEQTKHLFTGFIQDTMTIVPDRLTAMIGTKVEHNDFTGFEIQPSARLAWTPDDRQTIWAGVSRAVHTPSIAEDSVSIFGGFVGVGPGNAAPFVPVSVQNDGDVDSEVLLAYEAGYRVRPFADLTLDFAAFYFDYEDVVSIDGPLLDNLAGFDTYGAELSGEWRVADNLRLNASYSLLLNAGTGDLFRSDPRHQAQGHVFLDVTEDLEFNGSLYFTDRLESGEADAYLRLDLGVTWKPTDQLEFRVVGQNLLQDSHAEFAPTFFQATSAEVPRSVYLQSTFRF